MYILDESPPAKAGIPNPSRPSSTRPTHRTSLPTFLPTTLPTILPSPRNLTFKFMYRYILEENPPAKAGIGPARSARTTPAHQSPDPLRST